MTIITRCTKSIDCLPLREIDQSQIGMGRNSNIMVIGGYGDVGKRICLALVDHFPGHVIAAGRNYPKAKRFSEETNGKVLPRIVDVSHEWVSHEFEDIGIVIMALELPSTSFARSCLKAGINYIDITATHDLIIGLKMLNGEAQEYGTVGIVSVGLDPGVSNLLVKQCCQGMDYIHQAEINLLFGLGEDHGEGSIDWILDNLQSDYLLQIDGSASKVRSFGDGKQVMFPDKLGRHSTYNFNFSDQHVLNKTLGIPSVRTRMCFESRWTTGLLAALASIRFFKLLKYKLIRKPFKYLLKNLKMGSDIYAAKVSVRGKKNGTEVFSHGAILGNCEAQATAEVAALTARKLIVTKPDPGVFHIEELFEPEDILRHIKGAQLFGDAIPDKTLPIDNLNKQFLTELHDN